MARGVLLARGKEEQAEQTNLQNDLAKLACKLGLRVWLA